MAEQSISNEIVKCIQSADCSDDIKKLLLKAIAAEYQHQHKAHWGHSQFYKDLVENRER